MIIVTGFEKVEILCGARFHTDIPPLLMCQPMNRYMFITRRMHVGPKQLNGITSFVRSWSTIRSDSGSEDK